MIRTTRRTFLAAACGLALAWPALADDAKDKPAASGTWNKADGELMIAFLEKGVMKVYPHGDKFAFVVVCSYTVTKEGAIKAKITDLEASDDIKAKAKTHLPVGLEWSFNWKVKGDAATAENVEGKDVDVLKSHLEGEFKKKAD